MEKYGVLRSLRRVIKFCFLESLQGFAVENKHDAEAIKKNICTVTATLRRTVIWSKITMKSSFAILFMEIQNTVRHRIYSVRFRSNVAAKREWSWKMNHRVGWNGSNKLSSVAVGVIKHLWSRSFEVAKGQMRENNMFLRIIDEQQWRDFRCEGSLP